MAGKRHGAGPWNEFLWKGIKKGKSGGESTKYEYFNGKFHGWADADWAWVS